MNMNRFSPFRILLVALLMLAITDPSFAQKARLRLNLDIGDTFLYENITEQEINQDIMGQRQEMDQTIGFTYRLTVTDFSDDLYTMTYEYTRVQFIQASTMGEVRYDSDENPETNEPMARGYAAMVGQSFVVTMNTLGEVVGVTGVETMLDHMTDQFSDLPEQQREAIREQLKNQFGDEAMTANLQATMTGFPKKKVKPGFTWDSQNVTKSGFTLTSDVTSTVESIADGYVAVSTEGEMYSDPDSSMEMNGMNLSYDLQGTATGNYSVLITNGMISKQVVNQDLSGEVTASGGMMGNGMSWPIEIKSVSTMALLEEE